MMTNTVVLYPSIIRLGIKPSSVSLIPLGTNISVIQIQPTQNAKPNTTYNVPIVMNISTPAGFGIPTYDTKIQYPVMTATVLKALPLPPLIPPEFIAPLYAIIVSSLVGWSIPTIIGWVTAKKQQGRVRQYRARIKFLYSDGKLDENDIGSLDILESEIADGYAKGKITDQQYENLKNQLCIN